MIEVSPKELYNFFVRTKIKVFFSCKYGKNLLYIDRTKGTFI